MRKITILFLLLTLFLYPAKQRLTIASAEQNTTYDILAQSIKKIIESKTKYNVRIIHTRGSEENIKLIDTGKADMAIVQNDTAFYAKNGFAPFDRPMPELKMLMAFYDEPIYIVTNRSGINSVEQLRSMFVNIGRKRSGLLASSKVLLKTASVLHHIIPFYQSQEKSIRYLKQGRVQAIFLNTLNDEVKTMIDQGKWHIVPISKEIIHKIRVTYPYFSRYRIDDGTDTIAVKAILLADTRLSTRKAYEITKLLYANYDVLKFPKRQKSTKMCFTGNPLGTWHEGTTLFLNENKIVPEFFHTDSYIFYIVGAVLISLFVIVLVIVFLVHRIAPHFHLHLGDSYFINFFKAVYLRIIHHKYIIFAVILVSLYVIAIFFIKYFEHRWAILHNEYSSFDAFSLKDSLLWLFVFATSSYSEGVFPRSDAGKFIVSMIPMIGWGGLLTFATLLASDKIKQFLLEVKGMGSVNYKNHIILCGWNRSGCNIIEALTHDNIAKKQEIVILADEAHKSEIDLCILNQREITYLVGYAKQKEDLKRANLAQAKTVVVLQDESHSDPDAYGILDVLMINKYAAELGLREQKNREFQVIIQLHSIQNRQIAIDAGADQVVSVSSVESNMLANMVNTPGINVVIDEIFDFNDRNDIYSIDVVEGSGLIGTTYNDALVLLRRYDILLLSINIEYHRTDDEAQRVKEANGLDRGVITNPITPEENRYTIQEGDMLIVLAQYEKTVIEATQQLHQKGEKQ